MSATLFSPAEIASLTRNYLESRRQAKQEGGLAIGMPLYIKKLDSQPGEDDGFVPVQDGDLAVIISRPGHGKSSKMMRWARERTKEIRRRAAMGDQDAMRRVVVYATYEQTVEALSSFHVAATNAELGLSITKMAKGEITDAQWEGIEQALVMRVADPLWFIGHSIERRDKRPLLNLQALLADLHDIENWQGKRQFKIDAVFVDYIQRMPWAKGAESKTVGMSANVDGLKDIALELTTKVIAGCQAKAEVDKKIIPVPNQEDGEWTANITQTADVILSTVRPCKYKPQGATFNDGTGEVPVRGFKQMLITVCKQKVGDSNFSSWVDFDPRYNELDEADTVKVDFDGWNNGDND